MRIGLLVFSVWLATMIFSCQNPNKREFYQYKTAGKDLYAALCETCHGKNGEGLALLVPPLTDSVFLKVNKAKLACIIKNGITEPITIHNKIYQEKMPSFKQLTTIDIAKIIVYITNSFGNNLGMCHYRQIEKDLLECK